MLKSLDRQLAVWLLLLALTVATIVLGVDESGARVASVALILIGVFKLRLVALHFMEIRSAPLALRLIIELYAVGVGAALVVLYLAN